MAALAHLTPASEKRSVMRRPETDATHEALTGLLQSCSQGDRAAFRRLYDLTSHRVFGIVLSILRDRAVAEDIAQEVYVQIWRSSAENGTPTSNTLAWISAIARNKAIDRLRADRVRGFVAFTDDVPDIAGNCPTESQSAAAMDVRRALATLRPEYRKVLLLSYFRGYTQSELAVLLDTPIGTIKSWMTRGMTDLREALK